MILMDAFGSMLLIVRYVCCFSMFQAADHNIHRQYVLPCRLTIIFFVGIACVHSMR